MFSHLTKFRKNRDYEDLDGQDRVEMDITDPEMRQYVGMDDDGSTAHTVTDESPKPEPGDGNILTLYIWETFKQVLLQTVKTQMKCSIMLHFIRVYTVFKGKKDLLTKEYNIIFKL